MITIDTLEFNETFDVIHLIFDVGVTPSDDLGLYVYVGNCYLTSSRVDVTDRLGQKAGTKYEASIPIVAIYDPEAEHQIVGNCDYTKSIYDGIFTIVVENNISGQSDIGEQAIMNAYSISLALAHKILSIDNSDKLNETNLLYLLPIAAANYIEQGLIVEALEAYNKAAILCESFPAEYLETDVAKCSKGLGCWIVNGVYVKK